MDRRTPADDVRPAQGWLHTHNTAGGGRPSRRSSHRFLGVFTVLLGVLGVAGSIAPSASAAAVTDPGYVLYTNADGSIARWNPCHTIHYRVNDASGGPGALGDVFSAVTQLETASGLQLVYDGPSTDIPQSDYAAATNPDNPAPLLIAWAAPGQSNVLTGGSELGFSGTTVKSWTGPDGVAHPTQIVSGYTVFAATPALTGGFGPASYATRGRMLLHELGHIAGLMHTTDPNQVMYPIVDGRAGSYAAGDLAGLAHVGAAAGCLGAGTPLPTAAPTAAVGSSAATALTTGAPATQTAPSSAILAHYTAVGGASSYLGQVNGAEYAVPGGRAQDFTGGRVYWSPGTGAHEVHGAILGHYLTMGGPSSALGLPTTDETGTPDRVGRFNHFQYGSIYWTPTTGAQSIQGAIKAKWAQDQWETGFLGYPLTDERTTPDGTGRYNHLQGGSLYWTPTAGAHSVQGAIRDSWAAQGWERGPLGYPTSDEYPVPGGRQSDFQGGTLFWDATTGVVAPR